MKNEIIGNYRIEEKIGSGGYSRVYWASHIREKEKVAAIKIFQEYVDTPEARKKFGQEVHFLLKLRHEHIVPILGHGIEYIKSEDARRPYLITELAPYGSLRDLINDMDGLPLPPEQALKIITQVGEALRYAHENDIAHLDIKPENILFKTPDHIWLADLGIAVVLESTRTRDGGIAGTYAYMAPEQFENKVSKNSDQYALACIAYELLTGSHPFDTTQPRSLMHQHIYVQPVWPAKYNSEIPRAVCRVLLKGLAKDRSERYETAAEFVRIINLAYNNSNQRERRYMPGESSLYTWDPDQQPKVLRTHRPPQGRDNNHRVDIPPRVINRPVYRPPHNIYRPINNPAGHPASYALDRHAENPQDVSNRPISSHPMRNPAARSPRTNSRRLPRQPPRSRVQEFISRPEFLSVQPSTYLRQHYRKDQTQRKNWFKTGYIWLAPLMFLLALIVYLLPLVISSFAYTLPLQIIDCIGLFICLTGDALVEVYRDGHPLWNALAIATFVTGIAGILITWQQNSILYFFLGLLPMTLLSVCYRWRQFSKG